MYSASTILGNAQHLYTSKHNSTRTKVFVGIAKKKRYYLTDRTMYRTQYLKSEHWRLLRLQKLKANPSCEKCGDDKHLEPHHLAYKNLYDVQLGDLQTLCRRCHVEVHDRLKSVASAKAKRQSRQRQKRLRRKLIKKTCRISNLKPNVISKFIRESKWIIS